MVIFSPLTDATFVGDKPGRYKFLCSLLIYKSFRRGRMKPLFKRFRSLLIISILFLSLSAIQLIPFLELFIHSIRGNGISYPEATIWSFAPKDFLLFFLPDAYGYFLDMKKLDYAMLVQNFIYRRASFYFKPNLLPHPSPCPSPPRGRGN